MYKKLIILAGLMIPAMAMADRPAMSERYGEPDQALPERYGEPDQAQPERYDEPDQALPERYDESDQAQPMAIDQPPGQAEEVVVEQVSGDVLEMQPGDTIIINPLDFPKRGMSMDKVQNELGRPAEISPTVGEPPITSWSYPDRVVYFEGSKVIHVVEKR